MAHTYTGRGLPTACNIYRDGEPFALLTPHNMGKADYIAIMKFTEAVPDVIEALRDALAAMAIMDDRLMALTGSRRDCEEGEITRARAALAAIGAL